MGSFKLWNDMWDWFEGGKDVRTAAENNGLLEHVLLQPSENYQRPGKTPFLYSMQKGKHSRKTKKSTKIMAKNEKISIKMFENGVIRIEIEGKSSKEISVGNMAPEDKFRVIKEEILKMGIFFSEKIEKLVKKRVGLPRNQAV